MQKDSFQKTEYLAQNLAHFMTQIHFTIPKDIILKKNRLPPFTEWGILDYPHKIRQKNAEAYGSCFLQLVEYSDSKFAD